MGDTTEGSVRVTTVAASFKVKSQKFSRDGLKSLSQSLQQLGLSSDYNPKFSENAGRKPSPAMQIDIGNKHLPMIPSGTKITVRLFQSGKGTILGCRNEEEPRKVTDYLKGKLRKSEEYRKMVITTPKITSVNGQGNIGFRVDLAQFYKSYAVISNYSPEIQDAVNSKWSDPDGATTNLFATGNVSVYAKSREDLRTAFDNVRELASSCKA
ncbi:hypothetical protein J8273_4560 [Carpediemonas membranifera]|uniref:Uncharacterized protein n=1 Tax=Carpediemonas membranifera TaxID=201153 RepID=A0A8J6AXI0_9EUKA|nr:hypothetical protein J8273_4560 [Carpediemonas membranifera]|eukprot:KAG9393960.1 hypothetical protein J8273_4560 [Carpediemonas membranifera]